MKVTYEDLTLNLNGVKIEDIPLHIKLSFEDENIIDEALIKISFDTQTEAYAYLEEFIYLNYPQKKQSQDEKYFSAYLTKLKSKGLNNLETQITSMVDNFFNGSTLQELIKNIADEQQPYFQKLIKVSARTEWVEKCIIEFKTSLKEQRESAFPDFPTFD